MNAPVPDPALSTPKRCACDHGEQPCDSCLRDSDARLRALRERLAPEVHAAPDVTAAVQRAAKNHYAAKVSAAGNNWPAWDDAGVRWRQMTTWEVQAVGRDLLDVEEMARVLGEHEAQMLLPDGVAPDDYDGRDHWMCSCDHDYGVYDVGADPDSAIRAHEAQVLRTAILGSAS